jgi:hypothetical protein
VCAYQGMRSSQMPHQAVVILGLPLLCTKARLPHTLKSDLSFLPSLVPICGPLPPGLVKLMSDLQLGQPRSDVQDVPPAPTASPHPSGLPAQYPQRPTGSNAVQREVAALNTYTVDDLFFHLHEADQWGVTIPSPLMIVRTTTRLLVKVILTAFVRFVFLPFVSITLIVLQIL